MFSKYFYESHLFSQGSNNRVMDKEVIDFGSASDNCCPGGGIQHGVSCTPQGTPNKQKEAVRTMSVLSQEKQQLIEMANRLRTDLGMILKEGNRCILVVAYPGKIKPTNLFIL